MEIKEKKKCLRSTYLVRRKLLVNRSEKDKQIFERILQSDWYAQTNEIYTYVSYREEVDTRALISQAWSDGKAVFVPKVCRNEMDFYQINCMEDLEFGIKGILEPKKFCKKAENKAAVMIVPGTVFDREGYRIGYGGGFYDRYMENYPGHLCIALSYEAQIINKIPREAWDKKIDYIVTEEDMYEFN